MNRLLVMVFAALVFSLAGCKSQCRQLDEKQCDCALNTTDKNNCLTRASSNESYNAPTPDDEARCRYLVANNLCDCRLVNTTQGKINCGLARPLDGGQ